jgi:excisionase family DNA binding protein
MSEVTPIVAPLLAFCRANGVGKDRVYQLIRDGEITSRVIGRRRFIVLASFAEYLERQAAADRSLTAPPLPRRRRSIAPEHLSAAE